MRTCERHGCNKPLPEPSRIDRRFCSDSCRVTAHAAAKRQRLAEFKDIMLHENLSRTELIELVNEI